MAGAELLHIQGITYDKQERAQTKLSHKAKTDLAGNAFCAAAVFPLITAILSHCLVAEILKVEPGGAKQLSAGDLVLPKSPGDNAGGFDPMQLESFEPEMAESEIDPSANDSEVSVGDSDSLGDFV